MAAVNVAAAVLAVTTAAVLAGHALAGPHTACSPGCPQPAPATPSSPAPDPSAATPQQRLTDLAERIAAAPADSHHGPYSYTHVQIWARATTVVARFDTRKWWAADGSGRIAERRLPERAGLTRPPDSAESRQLLTTPVKVEDYGPGRLPPEVRLPLDAGPHALAEQFYTVSPREAGPMSLATAVSNINRTHYLGRAERADTLRVLATIPAPALTYRGTTVDLAGRPGLTWAIDTGAGTELLTFDTHTGELLVHQSVLNTSPPGLFSYVLFLEHDRVSQPS